VRPRAAAPALAALLLWAAPGSAYELMGLQWPVPDIDVYAQIELAGDPFSPSGGSWNQAFAEGVARWEAATDFRFDLFNVLSNPCAGITVPEDNFRNGVGFRHDICGDAFGSGTLAVTLTYYAGSEITEADIVFNDAEAWDVYSGPWVTGAPDFRRVAVHELGHVIGLDHEDEATAIMSTYVYSGDTLEAPTPDDIAGVNALYGFTEALEPIVASLEEPKPGRVMSGVSNVRGWAVSTAGIERVELYVDGVYRVDIPYGGTRRDVGLAYSEYPGADDSGFSAARNYSQMAPGPHTFALRFVDRLGREATVSSAFEVARFDNPFITGTAPVDLRGATLSTGTDTIVIEGMEADGRVYDLKLKWRGETQGFEIEEIR
jgi:hypothetical protein